MRWFGKPTTYLYNTQMTQLLLDNPFARGHGVVAQFLLQFYHCVLPYSLFKFFSLSFARARIKFSLIVAESSSALRITFIAGEGGLSVIRIIMAGLWFFIDSTCPEITFSRTRDQAWALVDSSVMHNQRLCSMTEWGLS